MWQILVNITPPLSLFLTTITGIVALFRIFVRRGWLIRFAGLLLCIFCYVLWFGGGRQVGALFTELTQLLGVFASLIVIGGFCIEEWAGRNSKGDIGQWREKAREYYSRHEYRKAITCYNQIIRHNPKAVSSIHYRANSYYALSEYEEAIKDFDRVLRLDPHYRTAEHLRKECYRMLGLPTPPIPH